jgi:hypothetical protein
MTKISSSVPMTIAVHHELHADARQRRTGAGQPEQEAADAAAQAADHVDEHLGP